MSKYSHSFLSFLLFGMLFSISCDKKKNSENLAPVDNEVIQSNRSSMLSNIAENIIIPGYGKFKIKLDSMQVLSQVFIGNPSTENLLLFRKSWANTYVEWQKVELYDVGPAQAISYKLYMNIFPTNTQGIEENILNQAADLELPLSYSKQGFPAIDYLINGLGSDADIVAKYSTATDASNRKAYLQKLVGRMSNLTNSVVNEWSGYKEKFITSTSLDAGSSTSVLTNNFVMHYEKYVRSGKIGIPSGALLPTPGSSVFVDKIESYYKKDLSLILVKTANKAAHDFFLGKSVVTGVEGASFKTYLDGLGAKDSQSGILLSQTINTQFVVITNKLDLFRGTLAEEVTTYNSSVLSVFDNMQALVRMMKVDMTSAMSITITYTDSDGD